MKINYKEKSTKIEVKDVVTSGNTFYFVIVDENGNYRLINLKHGTIATDIYSTLESLNESYKNWDVIKSDKIELNIG